MTVQIPLKQKYLSATKGKYKGGPNAAPLKHRVKIGWQKHTDMFGIPPVTVKVVDGATGKFLLVRR